MPLNSPCGKHTYNDAVHNTQVFRVKKLVRLPPQLELLADSVTSQVHDNLFKLAHTESIGMHIRSQCTDWIIYVHS